MMASEIRLAGQVAVVTGSGRGLGLAFAQALARAGASVVVNDVDASAAQLAVAGIVAEGGQAVCEVVPVGDTEAADRLVSRAVRDRRREWFQSGAREAGQRSVRSTTWSAGWRRRKGKTCSLRRGGMDRFS